MTQNIRLFGSWNYGYSRTTGTSLPGADATLTDSATPVRPPTPIPSGGTGSVNPLSVYSFGGDITLTASLVATRYGYFFNNNEQRGIPQGLRFVYSQAPTFPTRPICPALAGPRR